MKLTAIRVGLVAACAAVAALSACSSGDAGTVAAGASAGSPGAAASSAYLRQPTKLQVTQPLSRQPPAGVQVAYLNGGTGYAQQIPLGIPGGRTSARLACQGFHR